MEKSGKSQLLSNRGKKLRVAQLGALMLASALTEGVGLVLLVPLLSALGSGAPDTGGIARVLAGFGIPLAFGALLVMFVALVVLRAVINHARTLAVHGFEVAMVDGLRARAWRALLHCDWRTLAAMRQSDNASILITNIDRIDFGLNQLMHASSSAVTLAGLGLAAMAISPSVALAAIAAGVLVLAAYRGMRLRAGRIGEELGAAHRQVHSDVTEALGALRLVKSFAAEERMAQRSLASIAGLRRAQRSFLRDQGFAQIALQGGGALLLALLVWLAIARWGAGPARILPLVALFVRALPLLGGLQLTWQNWAHVRPAINETEALIAEAECAAEPAGETGAAPELTRAIRLAEVTVKLRAGRPALDAVELEIPANSSLAITGPSGAGKSTLADLLGALISPDSGSIAIDGIEIDRSNRRGWRAHVAYVQQEPVLFTGSVRENLLWGSPEASEAELGAALERAAAGFVLALPGGLDCQLGEGGRQLSGGERQRIALARALLRNPRLLILDEATSALDPDSEADVAGALARLRGTLTMVIVGHRGKLREVADRVIRIERGRIVADTQVSGG